MARERQDATRAPDKIAAGKTTAGLRQILELNAVKVRYNTFDRVPEWKRGKSEWEAVDTEMLKELRARIECSCVNAKDRPIDFSLTRLAEDFVGIARITEMHNPIRDYYESLPDFRGGIEDTELLHRFFGTPLTPLTQWASRYCVCAPCWRGLSPGCEIQTIPLLWGPKNNGKSTFVELLCPEYLRKYHNGGFAFNAQGEFIKVLGEKTRGSWIIEWAEFAGLHPGNVSEYKSWATIKVDVYRPPWGKLGAERFPRTWAMIATANPQNVGLLPTDTDGIRRVVAVECPAPKPIPDAMKWYEDNKEQLDAGAFARFNEGIDNPVKFPARLAEAQKEANEYQRQVDPWEEDMEKGLLKKYTYSTKDAILESRVLSAHATIEVKHARRAGRCLRQIGWDYKKFRPEWTGEDDDVKRWVHVKTYEEGGVERGKFVSQNDPTPEEPPF